jgi:hypothetical protein
MAEYVHVLLELVTNISAWPGDISERRAGARSP